MKVKMEITSSEVKAMVRAHLAARGFEVTDQDVTIGKNGAVTVTVEAALEAALPQSTAAQEPSTVHNMTQPLAVSEIQPIDTVETLPALRPIQGGAAPVDMSFVHSANKSLSNQLGEGLYPKPSQTLIDGESYDYPGTPTHPGSRR
jgi:hypothetical protein